MGIIVLALLAIIFIFLCTYTIQFQRAIIETARCISNHSEDEVPAELIDILTPKSQIVRNILNYILIITLFILGSMIYTWHIAIVILIISLCLTSLFVATFLPKTNNSYYQNIIKKEVEKRLCEYRSNGYASISQQEYLENILSKLRNIEPDHRYLSSKVKR